MKLKLMEFLLLSINELDSIADNHFSTKHAHIISEDLDNFADSLIIAAQAIKQMDPTEVENMIQRMKYINPIEYSSLNDKIGSIIFDILKSKGD